MKSKRVKENILRLMIYLSAFCTVLLLAGLIGYVAVRGIGSISWSFLTTAPSARKGTFGILGNIINTLYMIALTLLVSVPVGVGAAIYLNEYAKPGRLLRVIEFTTETLAGIPSIVFGLFGMVFFGNLLGFRYSLLTGALTMTMMVLPLIVKNTQESLRTVPDGYRQGALGMGAEKWYLIRTILLPSAMPGIVTGIILAMGRIVGESAALLFTAGSGYLLPQLGQYGEGLFRKIVQPGGTLTVQLYLSMQKAEYDEAFGIGLVLLVIVLGLNCLAKYLSGRLTNSRRVGL